ncbi:hypothetical protein G6F50_017308 [Rhizopus delemar]|uniref:Uncharacterized protein n=1 Tax=Rhizopus delemar TaxID=936053 RepID=A0A9P6XQH5_9FUNG|nr:hypothetical protein G6F50_017308 [Rhizopus delemar]
MLAAQRERQRGLLQQHGDRAAHQAAPGHRLDRARRLALRHRCARGRGIAAEAGQLRQLLLHQVAEGAIGHLRRHRLCPLGHACLAVQRAQVDLAGEFVKEEL